MKKLIFILLAVFVTSCMTTKTNVGNYNNLEGKAEVYSKTKQVWLFRGLIPLGRSHAETPSNGDCQVVTKFTFSDFLIKTITFGFVKTYTIKIYVKTKDTKHEN